jgi:hypothetical protein
MLRLLLEPVVIVRRMEHPEWLFFEAGAEYMCSGNTSAEEVVAGVTWHVNQLHVLLSSPFINQPAGNVAVTNVQHTHRAATSRAAREIAAPQAVGL